MNNVSAEGNIFAIQGTAIFATPPRDDTLSQIDDNRDLNQDPNRRWEPAVCYTLQPAKYFAGRTDLLDKLSRWARYVRTSDRVIVIVAPGGTGKTAIAHQVLLSTRGQHKHGIFVWSFYHNDKIDSFLRAACQYFTGSQPDESAGLLDHFQNGLRKTNLPHLLILDGLEVLQEAGSNERVLGTLCEPVLKHLIDWVAGGNAYGIKAKMLITSRFPIPSLTHYEGQGATIVRLNDLEPQAAVELLRHRGVRGLDSELLNVAMRAGCHALTIDVLGLYITRFCDGRAQNLPEFDRGSVRHDIQGARLVKILASYAANLPRAELDLLVRLSLFPNGITVELLEIISRSKRRVAGALAGLKRSDLINQLEALCALGILFVSRTGNNTRYSCHLFLRDYFAGLLSSTAPTAVFEAVRQEIAPSLAGRAGHDYSDPKDLDVIEEFITCTYLAGRHSESVDLYLKTLGGTGNLSHNLGETIRSRRILAMLLTNVDAELPAITWWRLRRELGQAYLTLGDVSGAIDSLSSCYYEHRTDGRRKLLDGGIFELPQFVIYTMLSLANATVCSASFASLRRILDHYRQYPWPAGEAAPDAAAPTESFLSILELTYTLFTGQTKDLDSCLGTFLSWGVVRSPLALYDDATQILHRSLRHLIRLGYCRDIRGRLPDNTWFKIKGHTSDRTSRSYFTVLLTRCWLDFAEGITVSQDAIAQIAQSAVNSGDAILRLECYLLEARSSAHLGDVVTAAAKSTEGYHAADVAGYRLASIDLRLEASRHHATLGNHLDAISIAESALAQSSALDCQYAWGEADSLHLLGIVSRNIGQLDAAKSYLVRAIERRQAISHPSTAESLVVLAALNDAIV